MPAHLPALASALALLGASAPALAHDGHLHEGLLAGLAHPLGGADHLFVTLGIGLAAGLCSRRASGGANAGARVPLCGALGLAVGATWAVLWPAVASGGVFEAAAAFGLLAIAIALLGADRLGASGLAALALAVAVPHGWLHGTEGSGAAFFAGLALSSAALFACGLGVGRAAGSVAARSVAAGSVAAGSDRVRLAAAAGYLAAFGWIAAG
jgi:urease accessory protein